MRALREHRKARGWTQPELAKRSGVCIRTICSAENGRPTRQYTKRLLMRALGIPWERRREVFSR